MDQLLALAVVVPLIAAAAISALRPLFRDKRRALDTLAILTGACVTAMLVVIMIRTWIAEIGPAPHQWGPCPSVRHQVPGPERTGHIADGSGRRNRNPAG